MRLTLTVHHPDHLLTNPEIEDLEFLIRLMDSNPMIGPEGDTSICYDEVRSRYLARIQILREQMLQELITSELAKHIYS